MQGRRGFSLGRRGRRCGAIIVVAAVGLAGLGACGEGASQPAAPTYERYVALGDSYTAAPGVDPDPAARNCARSLSNYPRLLGAEVARETVDVSCSGAKVDDLTAGQRVSGTPVAPQIEAITAQTDLVTVGIGGNDLDLPSLARACLSAVDLCLARVAEAKAGLTTLSSRIEAVLGKVRGRAPEATVLVVGYPTIVADAAPCGSLPLAAPVVEAARALLTSLDEALAEAARRSGATYVDLGEGSDRHGLCGDDPWIADLEGDGAQALHPTAAEQRWVSEKVAGLLSVSPSRE